jgi:histidinol-phosphatase (PHP family)
MKPESLQKYLNEIQRLKESDTGPEVYAGLEVDFIPGVISVSHFKEHLDYTVGSIHFVESFSDGRRWEIDGPHTVFEGGLERIFNNDIKAVIRRYFELTREMIVSDAPDILGHLDKIKIQNQGNRYFDESDKWYRDEIISTLQLAKGTGIIVEVNTRGLYQRKSGTPYPSPWVLEVIQEMGIPITLSSDAHIPGDLFREFEEMALLLMKMGFRELQIIKSGRWAPMAFSEKGLFERP